MTTLADAEAAFDAFLGKVKAALTEIVTPPTPESDLTPLTDKIAAADAELFPAETSPTPVFPADGEDAATQAAEAAWTGEDRRVGASERRMVSAGPPAEGDRRLGPADRRT